MKLLILTQAVDYDDPNLGALHRWYELLAARFETITIVTLAQGFVSLPQNVEVRSAGKERGAGHLLRRLYFAGYALAALPKADAIFVHMIPEYAILVGLPARLLRKKVYLWYAHKSVTPALRLAHVFVHRIFTSSTAGFRLPSKKVIVTGQAIDTEFFSPSMPAPDKTFVTVGRVSKTKQLEKMLEALVLLPQATLTVVGGPVTLEDRAYEKSLKEFVAEHGLAKRVHFLGPHIYRNIPNLLRRHQTFINLSKTGSLDKAVLEAMACGLRVLVSNEAYKELVPPDAYLPDDSPEELSARMGRHENGTLRSIVERGHRLESTIGVIADTIGRDTL